MIFKETDLLNFLHSFRILTNVFTKLKLTTIVGRNRNCSFTSHCYEWSKSWNVYGMFRNKTSWMIFFFSFLPTMALSEIVWVSGLWHCTVGDTSTSTLSWTKNRWESKVTLWLETFFKSSLSKQEVWDIFSTLLPANSTLKLS